MHEVKEEGGFEVTICDIKKLGEYVVGTQTNERVYMFYVDVTGMEQSEPEQDGSDPVDARPLLPLLMAGVAMTVALVVGVIALSLQGRITELNERIQQLQAGLGQYQAPSGMTVSVVGEETASPDAGLQSLSQRVAELTALVEGRTESASVTERETLADLPLSLVESGE